MHKTNFNHLTSTNIRQMPTTISSKKSNNLPEPAARNLTTPIKRGREQKLDKVSSRMKWALFLFICAFFIVITILILTNSISGMPKVSLFINNDYENKTL